jgi:hypothetical protein
MPENELEPPVFRTAATKSADYRGQRAPTLLAYRSLHR